MRTHTQSHTHTHKQICTLLQTLTCSLSFSKTQVYPLHRHPRHPPLLSTSPTPFPSLAPATILPFHLSAPEDVLLLVHVHGVVLIFALLDRIRPSGDGSQFVELQDKPSFHMSHSKPFSSAPNHHPRPPPSSSLSGAPETHQHHGNSTRANTKG